MKNEEAEKQLEAHEVKPTAVRLMVWKEASTQSETFSLADMERWLPTVERSSIFRTLKLLTEHHLLHTVDDGTGIQKYCVCRCNNISHLNHVHFNCLVCGRTYCLEDYAIPVVTLPDGFQMQEAEYVVKGICASCKQ